MNSEISNKTSLVRRCGRLVLLMALGCSWCYAQDIVLQLRNGDRITGRLLSETTNNVEISTAFSDNVVILKSLIDHRENVTNSTAAAQGASTNQAAAASGKPPLVPATGVASELAGTNKPAPSEKTGGNSVPQVPV